MQQVKFRAWNRITETYDKLMSIHLDDNGRIVSLSVLQDGKCVIVPIEGYELEQFTVKNIIMS